MHSESRDAQRARVAATLANLKRKYPERTTDTVTDSGFQLLVMQYDGKISCTDGMRRGFNGKQPRTSAPELTSDCIVTRPNGDVFIVKRTHKSSQRLTARKARSNKSDTVRAAIMALPSIHT